MAPSFSSIPDKRSACYKLYTVIGIAVFFPVYMTLKRSLLVMVLHYFEYFSSNANGSRTSIFQKVVHVNSELVYGFFPGDHKIGIADTIGGKFHF